MRRLRLGFVAALLLLPACGALAQSSPWGPPARQVWTTTNLWSFIPVSKTNVQLVLDWLDDKLAWSGSAWTNLPSSSTNSLQNLFDWLDTNWDTINVSNEVATAFPYLDADYRDDITNLAFASSGSTNWTFAKTNGVGYVGYPTSVGQSAPQNFVISTRLGASGQTFGSSVGITVTNLSFYSALSSTGYSGSVQSNSRIYAPTAGLYAVFANLRVDVGGSEDGNSEDGVLYVEAYEDNTLDHSIWGPHFEDDQEAGYVVAGVVSLPATNWNVRLVFNAGTTSTAVYNPDGPVLQLVYLGGL